MHSEYIAKDGSTASNAASNANVNIPGTSAGPESTSHSNISDAGVKFIASYEGCDYTPTRGDPDTWNMNIGYGHVIQPNEHYTSITQGQALSLLKSDLSGWVNSVNSWTKQYGVKLNQNQFDSLVSLSYNTGSNWHGYSFGQKLISGNYTMSSIKQSFLNIDNCGGKPCLGLWRRRYDEWEMFATGDYNRNDTRNW